MVISENSFAGFGTYVHHSKQNRVPLREAFGKFIGEINARIDMHLPEFERSKRIARRNFVKSMSRAQVVKLVGARVARKLMR